MVEFALILPLLLFVLFGIIEFARILQAWLSVENAARFGVRYAVTGEYSSAYCPTAAAELQAEDPTRFANIGANDLLDGSADCVVPSTPTTLSSYQIQTDALKDRARLYSIKEVATGAAVAILNNPAVTNETDVGFFKVTICSTRNLDGDAQNQPDFTRWPPIPGQFLSAMCVMDPDGSSGPLPFPVREVGPETMDPGGPGDRVIVTVDFNHPVIVPLISSLWPKLHLTSLRQGIVERFRVARVVGLPPTMVPPTNTSPPTDTPTSTATPTDTPTPTETATPTQTPTPTATATETLTPTPTPTADCSQSSSQFSLTNFILTTYGTPAKPLVRTFVNNASAQNTTMDSLVFIWAQYRGAFASAVITAIRFDGTTITSLFDTTSPTSWSGPGTQALDAGESDALEFEYRTVDPNWPGNTAVGYFGLTVTLGNGCVLVINALPTNTPTITQTPSRTPSPTITLTPSQTPTPTQTRTPTATVPTPTPTQTRTPTATVPTSTPTVTSAPTATPTPAPSRTPTATVPTPTQTDSPTPTATVPTPTRTNTPNVTRTPTATQTQTPTKTPTPTLPCLDC